MVTLTRSTGSVFALNSDLIERVDSTPETTITLIDGTTYQVRESIREVVERVRRYRGSVIAAASTDFQDGAGDHEPRATADALPRDGSVVPFRTREP